MRRASLGLKFWVLISVLACVPAGSGAEPPQRICSLSVAGDELLALLVPNNRVVCASTFVDDPEISNVAGKIPARVPRLTARIEPVLNSRPDLVLLAPWNEAGFARLLEKTGIRIYTLEEANTFPEIRRSVLAMAEVLGAVPQAQALVAQFDSKLADIDRRLTGIVFKPRVLAFSHLVVAGKGTTVDALIQRAGGRNAVAEIGLNGHQQLSLERIIALDPDWLLLGFDPGVSKDKVLEAYPLLQKTRAAREGRVLVMAPKRLTTVTPFLAEGVLELARTLHPESFKATPRGRR